MPYQDSYPPGLYVTPVVGSLAPASGNVGVSQTVTLTGTGFYPTTKGYVDGTARTTTYISPTQIRVTWTPGSVGTAQVTAQNGTKVSAQKPFTVNALQQEARTSSKGKSSKG